MMKTEQASSTTFPVSAVDHIALITSDLNRLIEFYERIFDAQLMARAGGEPRKAFLKLTPATSVHIFEKPEIQPRPPENPFDDGSINHFALQAASEEVFVALRSKLMAGGFASETVYDAPGLYTMFANDPDGLLIEVLVAKETDREPPFLTEPFAGLGQPSAPSEKPQS